MPALLSLFLKFLPTSLFGKIIPKSKKSIGVLVLVVIIGAGGYGVWKYITYLKQDIEDIKKVNITLSISNEQLSESRQSTVDNLNKTKQNLSRLNSKYKKSTEKNNELLRLLSDTELNDLLVTSPQETITILNNKTEAMFKDLETAANE